MTLFFIALVVVGSLLHARIRRTPLHQALLLYILAINVGIGGLLGFYMHAFRADWTASYIGWGTGSPFQFEVACADLAMGICGLLCIRYRDGFRLATVIFYSAFSLGAAYGHILQMIGKQNLAPGNAGAALYLDVLIPAT